jgi:DNA-binding NarL/FixJ family response regulator
LDVGLVTKIDTSPVQSGPVQSGPVQSGPVHSGLSGGYIVQTILIVDDHPLFRAAIRDILDRLFASQDCELTYHEASSFQEAFDIASAIPDLDLVTLDICMPDSNDLSGLLRFRARLPATPVVVVSSIDDPNTIRRTIMCGAVGFIPKASAMQAMTDALQVIVAGGIYMPENVPTEPAALPIGGDHGSGETGLSLTPRQAAVLERLVEGKSNKVIARELAISDMTVKVHVTAILRSLGVATRAQAIVAVRGELSAVRQSAGP